MSRPKESQRLVDDFRDRFPWFTNVSKKVTFWAGTYLPSIAPVTFVLGYPRSGTTWITSLVSEITGVPFVEASLTPVLGPCVYHGHEPVRGKYERAVYVLRDGRDAMVSLYFHLHSGVGAEINGKKRERWYGGTDDPDDVARRLPDFIQDQMNEPHGTSLNWADHVSTFLDLDNQNIAFVRYESMLEEPVAHLESALESSFLSSVNTQRIRDAVEKLQFERYAKRERGEEDRSSFHRKGIAGDWRNYFGREAAKTFDQYAGDVLVDAGYEGDRSWVEEVPELPQSEEM